MGFIAPLSLALGALGTGISAIGSITQGETASAEANYQAQVANNNAIAAQQSATAAEEAGETTAETASLQNRQAVGAIVAAQGASGIDPNTGSARATRESQRLIGRVNAATAKQQGETTAYEYRVAGTNQQAQAGIFNAQATAAANAGAIGAMGSLLGGAGNIGAKYAWMQTIGALPPPSTATAASPTIGPGTGGLY